VRYRLLQKVVFEALPMTGPAVVAVVVVVVVNC
jgi:hypothetical protein